MEDVSDECRCALFDVHCVGRCRGLVLGSIQSLTMYELVSDFDHRGEHEVGHLRNEPGQV